MYITTFGITVYIISMVLTVILFALKRVVIIQEFTIKVSLIDIFILTLRALLIMSIPIVNSGYVLINVLAWQDCIDDLRSTVRYNDYRLT